MAISPDKWESLALDIRDLYIKVSDEITKEIVKRTLSGIDSPDYLLRKQQDLIFVRRKTEQLIQELSVRMGREIEDIVEQAYYAGIQSAEEDIGAIKNTERISGGVDRTLTMQQTITAGFATIDRRTITVIVAALKGKLESSHLMILRSTNDAYRRIVGQVAAEALAGAGTRLQAAQKALNRFADQGITGFTTKNGSRWEIETYAEMATRSAIGQASIEGHIDRQVSYQRQAVQAGLNIEFDLVSVSNHPEECEKCRPWEGKILSLDGNHPEYPSLQQARDAGLYHPRCGHGLHTYVEGVTPKPPKAKPDPDGYEERQHQRYLERQIRHWKKRQLVAVTPEAQKLANTKVREWQSNMREWIAGKDRYRRYERESITGAR
jgi:hypothetical protein